MDSDPVIIRLASTRQDFVLPRVFITTTLAGSLFADALELDPTADVIPISQPVVTPAVMQFLQQFAQGIEPERHIPDLTAAHRYLGIPFFQYYADPGYDYIVDRNNPSAEVNLPGIDRIIKEDRAWAYAYLVVKGYVPTWEDLLDAAEAGAAGVVQVILNDGRASPLQQSNRSTHPTGGLVVINPRQASDPLRKAIQGGHTQVAKLLIESDRFPPSGEHFELAVNTGNTELVHWLWQRMPHESIYITALRSSNPEIWMLPLQNPGEFNPASGDKGIIIYVANLDALKYIHLHNIWNMEVDTISYALRRAVINKRADLAEWLINQPRFATPEALYETYHLKWNSPS